jgi:hypothetical protein
MDGQGNFIRQFERHVIRLAILADWAKPFQRATVMKFGREMKNMQPMLILGARLMVKLDDTLPQRCCGRQTQPPIPHRKW